MKKIKTIIVEDEPLVLKRFLKLLQKIDDIEVVETFNYCKETIEKFDSYKPDILFLDIELPDGTGLEIANEVNRFNTKTKIIFTTGFNQYAIDAIKKGAFDYLLKPIDIDELTATIERYRTEIDPLKKHDLTKYDLSSREKEILDLLLKQKTSKEIACMLYISNHTVDTHRRTILKKTMTKNTLELMKIFA